MRCEEVQANLTEHLTLGVALSKEVQDHLQSCESCKQVQAELQQVLLGLLVPEPAQAPAGLKEQVFARLHGGLTCEQTHELLLDGITSGLSRQDGAALQQHLQECPDCLEHSQQLAGVEHALSHAQNRTNPPESLKQLVLREARNTRKRPLLPWWGLGTAATVAMVLWVGGVVTPPATARLAPDPSVVVSAGNTVVFANSNQQQNSIVVLTPDRKSHVLKLNVASPHHFTEGVAEGERVYLLDTANQLLVVVNLQTLQVERTHEVHEGASGLSAQNGRAVVKCALSGYLTSIGKDGFVTEVQLGESGPIPREGFMDAVLQQGKSLWVTHHQQGMLYQVDASTLQVQQTLKLGGKPVALARAAGHLLVLDHAGRLLELQAGKVTRSLDLPGHPDKLTVAGNHLYLTDRDGWVSKVNLQHWALEKQQRFGEPMDITSSSSGELLLADATRGVQWLDSGLQVRRQVR